MFASMYLLSTNRRARAYLVGAVVALMVVVGSLDYTVKKGDSLNSIAAEYGVSVSAILKANNISDPDLILIGQHLVIPGHDGRPAQVHVVAAGETLGRIAAHYGTKTAQLASLNGIDNVNLIRIGQKLKIPGGGSGTSSGATGYHVVTAGETLASIAAKYGVPVQELAAANGITNPSLIYVGARLALGGKGFVAEGESGTSTHVVAAGETLGSIAAKYGVSISALAKANGIQNTNLIRIGQKLEIPGGSNWVCPVAGASYVNDWGFPRSGGRFHEGNDLMAPRGTEVRAPVSGTVKPITGTVGGFQFFLYGDDGVTYIGSHLDAFGRSGRVDAGEVIGYVGDTGNARGGPTHLHFEMHPDDGAAVNPFPTLQKNGC